MRESNKNSKKHKRKWSKQNVKTILSLFIVFHLKPSKNTSGDFSMTADVAKSEISELLEMLVVEEAKELPMFNSILLSQSKGLCLWQKNHFN